MSFAEDMMSHVQRAYEAAGGNAVDPRSLLADPLRLGAIAAAGEQRRLDSEQRLGTPVPRFCIFSVTWQCNLDCNGCYAKDYARGAELAPAEIDRVVREACELGSFIFVIAGGEPLLVDGLVPMLGRIDEALFFVFTNGTLLDDVTAGAIVEAGNIMPVVSIDGPAHVTDARRGEGVSAHVASAMDALTRAGAAFAFSSMVTHENLRHVTSRPWCDELWQAGARLGFLIDYVPIGSDIDEALVLTDADRECKAAAVADRLQEARPLVVNFPADEYAVGPCQAAGRGMIHINADGCVEPCPFAHYAADNVRDTSLAEILASPFFAAIRDEISHLPNPRGECLLLAHTPQLCAIAQRTGATCTDTLGTGGC